MPQTSGISVGRSGFVAPPQVMAESPKAVIQQPAPRGKLRLPAGPAALSAEDMSPSSSPDNESSLLATSAAVKRLEALSARRSSKTPVSPQPQQKTSPDLSRGQQTQQQYPTSQPLQRVQSNPIPAQFNTMHGQAFAEPSMPQTPTTRRRQMLATELPEDLRLSEWIAESLVDPKFMLIISWCLTQISFGNAGLARHFIQTSAIRGSSPLNQLMTCQRQIMSRENYLRMAPPI